MTRELIARPHLNSAARRNFFDWRVHVTSQSVFDKVHEEESKTRNPLQTTENQGCGGNLEVFKLWSVRGAPPGHTGDP